ncbi:Hypothetical protein phosphatase 2C T23F11.1, partial [Stegodyphus mimosarum]
MTNDEVVDFVRTRISAKMEPEQICEELMTRCLAPDCQMGGLGCDNMTVVLVCLLQGESYEELANKCSRVYTSPHDATLVLSESSASDAEDECDEDSSKSDNLHQRDELRDCNISTNRPSTVVSSNLTDKPPTSHLTGLVQMDNSVREGGELAIA